MEISICLEKFNQYSKSKKDNQFVKIHDKDMPSYLEVWTMVIYKYSKFQINTSIDIGNNNLTKSVTQMPTLTPG
jgi:alanyl-tRNA synthetase